MATIQEVQQVNIQCECHHGRGPLGLLRPWTWDRPCRRCQRMMERSNVVVVSPPTSSGTVGTAVTVTSTSSRRNRRRRASPVVIATTTQAAPPLPPQQQAPQVVSVTQHRRPPSGRQHISHPDTKLSSGNKGRIPGKST